MRYKRYLLVAAIFSVSECAIYACPSIADFAEHTQIIEEILDDVAEKSFSTVRVFNNIRWTTHDSHSFIVQTGDDTYEFKQAMIMTSTIPDSGFKFFPLTYNSGGKKIFDIRKGHQRPDIQNPFNNIEEITNNISLTELDNGNICIYKYAKRLLCTIETTDHFRTIMNQEYGLTFNLILTFNKVH